jgi:hypothetical protein
MKFTKKPIEIEAMMYCFDEQGNIYNAFRNWIRENDPEHNCYFSGDSFFIKTLEGTMEASQGDWVIKGIKGELYPCKPDIFDKLYDESSVSTMSHMTQSLSELHTHFGTTNSAIPFHGDEKAFRICAMQEELDEYADAKTVEDELDALVDLVVFAIGTSERQGMLHIFDEAFRRVMHANMQKKVGSNKKRGSFHIDLIKPEGWTAPDFSDLFQGKLDV